MPTTSVDHLVIGAGALGSAAAYWLSRADAGDVLVCERFAPGHARGSSHDHSRLIRHAYHSPDYTALTPAMFDACDQTEQDAGAQLVVRTGGLDLARAGSAGADVLRGYQAACIERLRREADCGVARRHGGAERCVQAWCLQATVLYLAGMSQDARRRTGTAVVTGGSRGIGLELVRQLAGSGMTVVLGARDPEQASAAAADFDGTVLVRRLDVTVPADAARLAAELTTVDVLINNAAIHFDMWQDAAGVDLTVVREALETNVVGAWSTTTALLPLMSRGGRIVNVSSRSGSFGETGGAQAPAYAVSKAALDMLTVKLAEAVKDRGILVNAMCPGWVATDLGGPGGGPVDEAVAGLLWAVDLPPDGPTGGFFRRGEPVPW